MMSNIRMSRITHPRATWWAMALLVVVFLCIGLWAEAHVANSVVAPNAIDLEALHPVTRIEDFFVNLFVGK